jgi:alkanesulfonate monooxygenase SsuD/methylene tetrahydromethanopterin reductase-like flavin-dependent oxidoreductase (luciferase family)
VTFRRPQSARRSGPQVIEGFHGVKYDAPVQRAREHVDICRKLWRREPSDYQGRYYSLPLTKTAADRVWARR